MKSSLSFALGAGAALAVIAGMVALHRLSESPVTGAPSPESAAETPSGLVRTNTEPPVGRTPAMGSALSRPPTTTFAPASRVGPEPTAVARPPVAAAARLPRGGLPSVASEPANFRVITHAPGDVEIELDDRATIPAVFASGTAEPVTAMESPNPADAAGARKIAAMEDRIADEFIREVSSKPDDQPLSLDEYQNAAYLADERLRALLGVEEYKARSLRAAKEGLKKGQR